MDKYNGIRILKKRLASTNFKCKLCKQPIKKGNDYYSEEIKDKFLHALNRKKFCRECVERFKRQLPPIVN